MSFFDQEFAWEEDPYELIREALAPEYSDLPPQAVEALLESAGLSAEDMEFSLKSAAKSVGSFAKSAAPAVLPVAGTVIGGAFGGPLGAAAGGALGRAAGGAIGGAGGGRGKPAKRRKPGRPGAPPSPPAATGSPAAAQLLQVLERPELLQALIAMALGQAGRSEIPVGDDPVPATAFANLAGSLAGQAAAEYHALNPQSGAGVPTYLLDDSGEFAVDPSIPEQRAARLLELLNEAAWQEQEAWEGEWAEDEPEAGYDDLDAAYDDLEIAEMVYDGGEG